jgi:hypothetical protein
VVVVLRRRFLRDQQTEDDDDHDDEDEEGWNTTLNRYLCCIGFQPVICGRAVERWLQGNRVWAVRRNSWTRTEVSVEHRSNRSVAMKIELLLWNQFDPPELLQLLNS